MLSKWNLAPIALVAALAVGVVTAPVAQPPTMTYTAFFLPGLPVVVVVPATPLVGTQTDWAAWGWRPFIPTQQAVTGSDG